MRNKNKHLKGFSLAELLVSLLIISIVLSVAIPTITRKSGQQRELIWRWTDRNNVAFTAVGANQSVIIGSDNMPMQGVNTETVLQEKAQTGDGVETVTGINPQDILYSDAGDKLVILKRKLDNKYSDLLNSHITFYNTNSSPQNATYAGRLAMDSSNIALGKGSLQSLSTTANENTAIGHYTLLRNTTGYRNTAIGQKALSNNTTGQYNTALGLASGIWNTTGSENTSIGSLSYYGTQTGSNNTVIGSQAMKNIDSGDNNTVVGQLAMRGTKSGNTKTSGSNNTVVGSGAFSSFLKGDDNIVLGSNACQYLQEGYHNICIGAYSTGLGKNNSYAKDDFGFYIGDSEHGTYNQNGISDTTSEYAPLLSGHTRKYKKNNIVTDQEFVVNARKVKFNSYIGDTGNTFSGSSTGEKHGIFEFETLQGTSGYEGHGKTRYGIARFGLIDSGSNDDYKQSIFLGIEGKAANNDYKKRFIDIKSYDPYLDDVTDNSNGKYTDWLINNNLFIDFPPNDTTLGYENTKAKPLIIRTGGKDGNTNGDKTPLLLNDFLAVYKDTIATPQDYFPRLSFNAKHANPDTVNKIGKKMFGGGGFKIDWNEAASFSIDDTGFHILSAHKGTNSNLVGSSKEFDNEDVYFHVGSSPVGRYKFGNAYNDDRADIIMYADFITIGRNGIFITQGGEQDSNKNKSNVIIKSKLVIEGLDNEIKKIGFANSNQFNTGNDVVGCFKAVFQHLKAHGTQMDELKKLIETAIGGLNSWSKAGDTWNKSDLRLKNIKGDNKAGLKEINQLEVKDFTFKDDKNKTPHVGVIAQQLQKIFPNAVKKDEKGFLMIRQEDIFYALVNSVKELCAQLQDIVARISGLDKRLTELEEQNRQLREKNAAFEKRFEALEKRQTKLEGK